MRLPSLAVLGSLAVLAMVGAAPAQSPSCNSIKAQIAALSRGDPGRAATYGRAAQKQRAELDSTSAYANSIGCGKRKFLIFGEAPPAQCGAIESRMQQMRANLGQLQARSGEGGNDAAIRDLSARYNSECRAPPPQVAANVAPPPQRGFFEGLFGGPGNNRARPPVAIAEPEFTQVPLEPVRAPLDSGGEDDGNRGGGGGSRAVCVRKCDGSFFPVSYSARNRNLDGLQDLCRALCPNAEVEIYTMSGGGEIGDAVSADGESYTSLANAFKFQKSYDATCSCKAKGKSWVETLAEAEKVLGRQKSSDILVTQKKADELARPNATPRRRGGAAPVASAGPAAPASAEAPEQVAGADADFKEITGPDGIKRRVRIIGLTR